MKPKTTFPDVLRLEDAGMRGSSRVFRLIAPFRYHSSFGTIRVPQLFETDGASIPRMFWPIFSPIGPALGAAVIHDYLYTRQSRKLHDFDRWEADDIFKEAMFNAGLPWTSREPIFLAVRMFGWRSYLKRP
jgi:hypothetical protein